MAIRAITKFENNKNINFQANEPKNDKSGGLAKTLATTAAVAGLGYGAYRGKWVEKSIKALSDSSFLKKHVYPNYEKDNLKFMSLIGVSSIILKDGLGCYLYVKQSLNNKEIPDDKRKFVAALDLANGGLMIATQILAFFTVSDKRVQQKLFNAVFGKKFTRSASKALQAKLRKVDDKFAKMTGDEFHKGFDSYKKGLAKAFGYLISLASASIFAKRMVVPFIATPLADKAKVWMSRNDKPAETHKDTENTYNSNKIDDKPEFKGSAENQETKNKSSNLLEIAKQNAEK